MKFFKQYLTHVLQKDLPGWTSQKKMSPYSDAGVPERVLPVVPKKSAVLVLFYPDTNNEIHVVYTLRTQNLSNHSGQISFPGGRSDKNETPIETALRETHEEIGVPESHIEVLGNLSKLDVYHSNSRVQPIVAVTDTQPTWRINPYEVAEIITFPLRKLQMEETRKETKMHLGRESFTVPYYEIHSTPLWGATAMITSELIDTLSLWDGHI